MDNWERLSAPGDKCGAYWRHRSGWAVQHCGHPTANCPYYGIPPEDGRAILTAANGRGFRLLRDALHAVAARAEVEAIAKDAGGAYSHPIHIKSGALVGHVVIGGER